MRTLLFVFVLTLSFSTSFAQDKSYIKRPTLGINFFLNDFKGAAFLKKNNLSLALRDKQLSKFNQMTPGLTVNYLKGLANHFDVSTGISASFLDYPIANHAPFANDNLLLEADVSVLAKLFSDKYWFTPYLSAGVGASKYKGYYGAIIPVGGGLQLNLYDEAFLFLNTQYRIGITENTANHLYHSIGIAGNIGKNKEAQAIVPAPLIPVVAPIAEAPKDTDADGVLDSLDACPSVAGLAIYKGCPPPDKDKDGINDEEDKCPDVAGLARYQGCPIPDKDNDAVNDEEDKCPDVAGLARYQGCPIPDKDNDAVNDEEDKCPDVAGEVTNAGCPVIKADVIKKIEFAAKNIFFASGQFKLLAKSNKSLAAVAKILNDNKDLKLDIDGYTDNKGKPEKNLLLSQSRSDAVKKFLVSKGVEESRLTATGHGQDNPKVPNKTNAARAQNRRVELHLRYF